MRDSLVEPRNDVTTPKKTWSTYVSTYRSFSDPETLCAKVHLLDKNIECRSDLPEHELSQVEDVPSDDDDWENVAELVSEVGSIQTLLEQFQEKRQSSDSKQLHVREWHMISCIIDRVFFFFYAIINVVGLLAVLIQGLLSY